VIDGLRPYPETRESGLPWLGDMPAHWQVRRNGRLFGPRRETGFPDLPILEVSIRTGVRIRNMENGARKQEMADRSKYQRAVRGDIAYNMMRMWQGAVGIAPAEGLVSPAYVVARPLPETDAAYYAYLFRTAAYMREIDTFSRGIVPDRNRLYWESFKQMPSTYPPLDEQRLIVRFLDWHGAQTAKLVRAKKQIIALLNEQKQAIIHRAVTRGLDPDVNLKPSGIPWLGDVPEEWDVARLRYIARCLDGQRVPLNGTQRGSMQGEYPYWGANRVFDHINAWLFDEPLVLLGEDGAPFFEVGKDVAFAVGGKIWVNNHAHVLRCGPRMNTRFLTHALNCVDYRNFISGSTRDKLTQQAMGSIPIQIPRPSEQQAIVTFLDEATSELVATADQIQNEIALVHEFRTRLIADVVTGKLDVRAVATTLPEAIDLEPIEEPADIEEVDEIDDSEDEEVAA
jgi:type I restriction enzyme S subunit